ncbi:MAG: helix-turn-helix transcriptional regulator [Candidatus Staskawiczbacteria bacterium]|nr:helix-turn-helix transcriptional regulator [Candidatus Staskawiczbacteria bacterium]
MKEPKQFERYFKGVANHRRIQILLLVAGFPNICLENIAKTIDSDIKNVCQHTQKLVQAGLLNKKYNGRMVGHSISPYGKKFISFMRSFQK